MQSDVIKVTQQVLKGITPTFAEKRKMEQLASALEQKVAIVCEKYGVEAIVRVEGSVAKDTWLKGDPDIDVFMRFPPSVPRKSMAEISLKVAHKATEGFEQVERFADHPYLEAYIGDTRVNIVPCYLATPGEWLSATDRTPYHTDYINNHMKKELHREVRLLKKFMKGVGVYGAEIKVGGFSGYLCELLTLHYGSFIAVLQAFARYLPKRIIDIEGQYKERLREIELLFSEPLVIIDPVDKSRNVASAVQPQKLQLFSSASQTFLKEPNKEFFYPKKSTPLKPEALKSKLENCGSDLIFLAFDEVKTVPDILWGQLYKTKRSLRKQLELNDFTVLRDAVWNEEKQEKTIIIFELEQHFLPVAKKHLGPPLTHESECEKFLSKYTNDKNVLSGPYIEDDRWIVQIPRKQTDAIKLLKSKLKDGGKEAGVADLIARTINRQCSILINLEIIGIYKNNQSFALFLTEFLSGKPFWLKLNKSN